MDAPEMLAVLPVWYAAFLLSLTCHEAAHAYAAYRGGDDTAYRGGQVSLNPIPHIRREPLGTVLVPLLTYPLNGWMMGWASAPYDPAWEDRHPRRAAAMAAAGPAANLVLALVAFLALRLGLLAGVWGPNASDSLAMDRLVLPVGEEAAWLDGVGRLLSVVLFLNVALFTFNLFPIPPLDGASVMAGLIPPARRLREVLRGSPLATLAGLIIAWRLFPWVFSPIGGWVLYRLFD